MSVKVNSNSTHTVMSKLMNYIADPVSLHNFIKYVQKCYHSKIMDNRSQRSDQLFATHVDIN